MSLIHFRQSRKHMATTFTFTVSVPSPRLAAAETVVSEAHHLMAALERELSEFHAESPVARLNAAEPGVRVVFPESAWFLLMRSEALRVATGGAFHPLAKSEGPATGGLGWDEGTREVWRTRRGIHLGFGAIGKGYALDGARAVLEREGFHDYLLSAGGSSQIICGFSAPGVPWRWGWSWRKDGEGNDLGIVFEHRSGEPIALGVSGFHEKGRHIRDGRTGTDVEPAVRSALVGHRRAADADALSTALIVGGWDSREIVGRAGEEAIHLDGTAGGSGGGRRSPRDGRVGPALAVIDAAEVPRWNHRFQSLWGAPLAAASCPVVFLASARAFAEEIVAEAAGEAFDLSALGVEDFAPYALERNPLWILLPLLSLALVVLHLKRPRKKSVPNPLESRR